MRRVAVAGWDEPAYVPASTDLACLPTRATHTTVLSPFDPVVWDRERVAALFGFDYRLECYTPARKRRHGYFVLPILDQGRLVGRLDAKAHRAEGRFEIRALHLEERTPPGAALAARIARALASCARWHGTPRVVVRKCAPRPFAPTLRHALATVVTGRLDPRATTA